MTTVKQRSIARRMDAAGMIAMYLIGHGSELPADCTVDETTATKALELARHLSERYGGSDEPESVVKRLADMGIELQGSAANGTRITPGALNDQNGPDPVWCVIINGRRICFPDSPGQE